MRHRPDECIDLFLSRANEARLQPETMHQRYMVLAVMWTRVPLRTADGPTSNGTDSCGIAPPEPTAVR